MDYTKVCNLIAEKIKKAPFEYQAYEDYYGIMKAMLGEDKGVAVAGLKWLSETINERMPAIIGMDLELGRQMMGLHRKVLRRRFLL